MTGLPPGGPGLVDRAARTGPEPHTSTELVVLLDDSGEAIGTAPKATVHTATTPLHRAFSCYLFDPDGRLLLTRRAPGKTFAALWTNSLCGHPGPGESDLDAIGRRADDELGLQVTGVTPALPDFRYRAEHEGVVENEVCPVYLARTAGTPRPHPGEVDGLAWVTWPGFLAEVREAPARFSPWSRRQALGLHAGGHVRAHLQRFADR